MMKKLLIILFVAITVTAFGQEEKDYNYEYALTEASRLKITGELDQAVSLYQKCIDSRPKYSVAYYELGSIYVAREEYELAEEMIGKAYNLDPYNYWYVLAYNQILKTNNKQKEAIKVCRKYLKMNKDTKILYSIAESFAEIGQYSDALDVLNGIENENGISEMISLKKVEICKQAGMFGEGLTELLKLQKKIPESPEYNVLLAEYLEESGKKDEAIKYYQAAFDLDSTNIYAITNLADYYNHNGLTESGFYFLGKAFTLSQITAEKKVNTLTFFLTNDSILSRYKNEVGNLVDILSSEYPGDYSVNSIAYDYYNKNNRVEKAYTCIRNLVKLKSDNFIIWQQALYNATRLQKYDDIIQYGNDALKYFPNKPELKLFVGIAWYQKGMFDKSFEILRSGFNDDLEKGVKKQYLTFLGEAAYRAGNYEDSFSYFEKLLVMEPDNDQVKNNYCYYMALKDYNLKRAIELSGQTVERDPENGTFLDTYGWILYKSGDYEQAKIFMEKALKNSTENSELCFHYAEILYQLGDKNMSLTWYEKAKAEGLNTDELNDRISELKND